MLDGAALLEIWERGQVLDLNGRALAALSVWSGEALDESLPLDEMTTRLLRLRAEMFGPELEYFATCTCGEQLEFAAPIEALLAADVPPPGEESLIVTTPCDGELSLRCRVPSVDAITQALASPVPRRALFEWCVEVADAASPTPIGQLGDDVVDEVEAWLDEHHPMLDIALDVECPECGSRWREAVDVAGHVWGDIDLEVRRLLSEVAILARTYHWSEPEILAMSKQRRAHYLEALA
jgi:hypothetical protein